MDVRVSKRDEIVAEAQNRWYKPIKDLAAFQVNDRREVVSEEVAAEIKGLFAQYGYFDAVWPQEYSYDAALILGATIQGMVKRTRWVVDLVLQGKLKTRQIVWSVSERSVDQSEPGKTKTLPSAMVNGLITEQLLTARSESEAAKALLTATEALLGNHGVELLVDTTPNPDVVPSRSANTEETMRHWQAVSRQQYVLLASNNPFAPRQFAIGCANLDAPVVDLTAAKGNADDYTVGLLLSELAKTLFVLQQARLVE
ncbi:MAG: hypothetical protein JW816_04135 [Candidatus Buchananbacteria bacterium]|nr:hypothetical protein [Candidatus Buchananbacteria bacterium]